VEIILLILVNKLLFSLNLLANNAVTGVYSLTEKDDEGEPL